jgi:hypothetical protein
MKFLFLNLNMLDIWLKIMAWKEIVMLVHL